MPSYPPFLPPWKEISRRWLASAFPSVERSLWIWRQRFTYINVSEYPNLNPQLPALPSLTLPDTQVCVLALWRKRPTSLSGSPLKKGIFQDVNKSPYLPLDITAHLVSLLRNFKLCLCSKSRLGRDVCLWRVLRAEIWRVVGQEECVSAFLLSACVLDGAGVWCMVCCRVCMQGEGKRFVRAGEVWELGGRMHREEWEKQESVCT